MYQVTHYKEAVYPVIAEESLSKDVRPGITVKRSYASNIVANTMGTDGSYVPQGFTDTDESLTVDQRKEATVTIEELSKIQTHLDVQRKYAEKSMNALFTQIDADVLGQAQQGASSVIDDGFLGGTTGNGLSIGPSNIANLFVAADAVLRLNNVRYNTQAKFTGNVKVDRRARMGVAIITPYVNQALTLYLGSKTSKLGDEISIKGYSTFFSNFNVFVSNNLPWTAKLLLATVATAGDTFTINGVTFTFQASGAAAGNVQVCDTAAHQATNIANALNAVGTAITNTASAGYVPVSAANQLLLSNMSAVVDATTNTTVDITMNGYGNVIVSSSFTSANNSFPTTQQKSHCIFGVNNSISVAMQKEPNLYINPVSQKVAKDYVTWCAYGRKVFNDQKYQLIDAAINSSSFLTAPTSQTY